MVGFGQIICLPVGPRCDLCLLGQKRICPSRNGNVKVEGRKEVVYTYTAEVEGEQVEGKREEGLAMMEVKYEEVGDEVKVEVDEVLREVKEEL